MPSPPSAPETAPETANIYRSLFNQLRRVFGGTIDDANADAIAFAASELYRKDVEPRLWEDRTAQEILDSFGVPRAGAFTRYSLADRLLLLRRSATPTRTEQAHALLTELGAPEHDPDGAQLSLKDRVQALLEGTEPPAAAPPGAEPGGEPRTNWNGDGVVADDSADAGANGSEGAGQLAEALQTIGEAVRSEDGAGASSPAPASSPDLPVAELVGLGTVIAGIQEELIRLREEVETVQGRLDEVLSLLRSGTAVAGAAVAGSDGPAPPVAAGSTEAPPVPDHPGPEAAPAEAAPADAAPVEAPGPPPVEAPPVDAPPVEAQPEVAGEVAPDDVTQVVPVVGAAIPVEEPAPTVAPRRRRRSLPKLILIAVVLGLLIAGAAIAISVAGWSELRSTLRIGSLEVYGVPSRHLTTGAW